MKIYKYTYDKNGKTFTQTQWIEMVMSKSNFNTPLEQSIVFYETINLWNNHIEKTQTIIPIEQIEENFWKIRSEAINENILKQQKGKESVPFYLGCSSCHKIHETEYDGFPSLHPGDKQCLRAFTRRIL